MLEHKTGPMKAVLRADVCQFLECLLHDVAIQVVESRVQRRGRVLAVLPKRGAERISPTGH